MSRINSWVFLIRIISITEICHFFNTFLQYVYTILINKFMLFYDMSIRIIRKLVIYCMIDAATSVQWRLCRYAGVCAGNWIAINAQFSLIYCSLPDYSIIRQYRWTVCAFNHQLDHYCTLTFDRSTLWYFHA